ncbi:hypothetical protein C8F04DRAFT_1078062 [Mycena alexandri]|uniref:C3H1-type domain-containing protein n=1 Tax=Mycena alexandri TaxID=1745969 RepID=A0AAD6XE76_9AGAR|nr:hypothetical protein C8F04DRAFT_1078062 [Mycena alexandri]
MGAIRLGSLNDTRDQNEFQTPQNTSALCSLPPSTKIFHRPMKPLRQPSASELEKRASDGEKYKILGNDLFREGEYAAAAAAYNLAVDLNGTQPVYMSNLAATYLKLENYEMAEKAATGALIHDPRMIKARFRRGLARLERGLSRLKNHQFTAAKTDFETVLRLDSNCAEAKSQLTRVLDLMEYCGEVDDGSETEFYERPAPDCPPQDPIPMFLFPESDSEEEDRVRIPEWLEPDEDQHVGNGIPCKHHNLKPLGCAKGESCVYSHAPDARSFPDSEGRNVCLYFLLGACKFGDRCLYSHSKANLPKLWEDESQLPHIRDDIIRGNEEMIKERRLYSKYMGKGPFGPPEMIATYAAAEKRNAKQKAKRNARNTRKAREAGEFLRMLDSQDAASTTAPFIIHLTLNKSTNIPSDTVSALREVVDVSRVKSKTKAMSLLPAAEAIGVFITDAGITQEKNAVLLMSLVSYVESGGIVVIGGSFKTFEKNKQTDVTPTQLEAFFQEGWGLPWKMGTRRPTDLALNTHHQRAEEKHASGPLPTKLSMREGQHLKGVRADAALYLPMGHSQLDSAGFGADNLTETPVAFAEIGKGRLGFVGDLGTEKATTDVILAMFGLSKV